MTTRDPSALAATHPPRLNSSNVPVPRKDGLRIGYRYKELGPELLLIGSTMASPLFVTASLSATLSITSKLVTVLAASVEGSTCVIDACDPSRSRWPSVENESAERPGK